MMYKYLHTNIHVYKIQRAYVVEIVVKNQDLLMHLLDQLSLVSCLKE